MNKFEAWAITIAILLAMAAIPARVYTRLLFVFLFLPLLLVGLLIFI